MKSVLIIAYYFPPLGGGGVQRTLKFVKYLPTFNYRPIILTPNSNLIRYIAYDYSLLSEIPKYAKIYNTFILDFNWLFKILYGFRLKKLVEYINKTLLFPDYQIQWLPFAKMKIIEIMKKEKIDVVYITSPPHSTQILGTWIKKNYHVPVVTDFRDPFTFNYKKKDADFFNKCFNFEKKVLVNADFVIANTSVNKNIYIEKFDVSKDKIEVITNGYDKSDFENVKIEKLNDKKIIFSHIGQFYGDYNAQPFLYALSTIKNEIKDIEFRFIGKVTEQDKKLIKKLQLERLIKLYGYCSHKKALEYLKKSDFLILIVSNSNWNYWIPGKTFEYINSGRKILAILPENGNCAEIIRNTKTGVVISPDKINKIAKTILNFTQNYRIESFVPNNTEIQKYERRNLTKILANIFNEINR